MSKNSKSAMGNSSQLEGDGRQAENETDSRLPQVSPVLSGRVGDVCRLVQETAK